MLKINNEMVERNLYVVHENTEVKDLLKEVENYNAIKAGTIEELIEDINDFDEGVINFDQDEEYFFTDYSIYEIKNDEETKYIFRYVF